MLQGLGSSDGHHASVGLPTVSLASFLSPGSMSAQGNVGLPTVPSSPYIFRGSNQTDARKQIFESDQPFAARLRVEEGKTVVEEEEEEEQEEREGKDVAELVRQMEASNLRLPGGYQAAPVGAYHLAPLPSGNFQSGPSSYQPSPSTYLPGTSSHQPESQPFQASPLLYQPGSNAHQGDSESHQSMSPPSYQPPPSISKHQQQEDIKVIHFGVV